MSDVSRSLQSWVSTIQTVVLTADVFQLFIKWSRIAWTCTCNSLPISVWRFRLRYQVSCFHLSLKPSCSMRNLMIFPRKSTLYLSIDSIPRLLLWFLLPSENVSYMIWSEINRISSSPPVFSLLSLWDGTYPSFPIPRLLLPLRTMVVSFLYFCRQQYLLGIRIGLWAPKADRPYIWNLGVRPNELRNVYYEVQV